MCMYVYIYIYIYRETVLRVNGRDAIEQLGGSQEGTITPKSYRIGHWCLLKTSVISKAEL